MDTIEIFKLYGSILVNNDKANDSISKTEQKAGGLGSKLGAGIKTAAKWGAAIGASAALVGGAMMGAANKVAEATDEVDKASRRAGTSAENWQKLNYAFGQSGIESTKLEQTMIRNQRSLNDAAEGSKTASVAYEKLGVSIKDSNGKLRQSDDVYKDVLNNLADLEDKNLRNSIANDIFGKSYGDLAPILDSGSDGIKELTDRADELGLVMSQEAVDAGVLFGDTLDDVKQAGSKMFLSIAGELLPILQTFLDWILAHMPEIKRVSSSAFKIIGTAVGYVITLFKALYPALKAIYDFISPYFPLIAKIVKTSFGAVITIVKGVVLVFEKATGAIKKAYNWLTSWNNKDAKNKTVTVTEKKRKIDGSNRDGLAYVPYDGYISELHKGERVLTAQENKSLSLAGMGNITLNITGNYIKDDYDSRRIADIIKDELRRELRR